jgi:hypothetical protein
MVINNILESECTLKYMIGSANLFMFDKIDDFS